MSKKFLDDYYKVELSNVIIIENADIIPAFRECIYDDDYLYVLTHLLRDEGFGSPISFIKYDKEKKSFFCINSDGTELEVYMNIFPGNKNFIDSEITIGGLYYSYYLNRYSYKLKDSNDAKAIERRKKYVSPLDLENMYEKGIIDIY